MYPITAQITEAQSKILTELVGKHSVRSVLEIGTFYGSSAKVFADAIGKDGSVVTIERMHENYEIASKNLASYPNIELIHADASEYLPQLNQKFDLIFIDANKSQYPFYLEQSLRLISDHGVIVADNTNFRSMVLTDEEPIKRYRAIVRALREFHKTLDELKGYKIDQLDIEDGMTVIRLSAPIRNSD